MFSKDFHEVIAVRPEKRFRKLQTFHRIRQDWAWASSHNLSYNNAPKCHVRVWTNLSWSRIRYRAGGLHFPQTRRIGLPEKEIQWYGPKPTNFPFAPTSLCKTPINDMTSVEIIVFAWMALWQRDRRLRIDVIVHSLHVWSNYPFLKKSLDQLHHHHWLLEYGERESRKSSKTQWNLFHSLRIRDNGFPGGRLDTMDCQSTSWKVTRKSIGKLHGLSVRFCRSDEGKSTYQALELWSINIKGAMTWIPPWHSWAIREKKF